MPILLKDTRSFEVIMTALGSQVSSIRHFDAAPADRLKQMINRLRVRLSMLVVLRADLEASAERTASELRAERELKLEDIKK